MLKARIEEGLQSEEKTERGRFTHHRTALNTLLKKQIVSEANLTLALTTDLSNTLFNLRVKLESEGKSDTRSPQTRVRRLAEFYSAISNINVDALSFTETLQAATKRKYGDRLWTGPITPKTQKKIKTDYITYREVAKEIISTAIASCPEAWVNVKSTTNPPGPFGSASKVLRDYLTGESIPAERVPDIRIHFIESFFHLPHNTLLNKILRKVDHNNRGLSKSEKDLSAVNRKKYKYTELSPDLHKVFDEYCAYKIHGAQPVLANIPESLRKSEFFEQRAKVREKNKRSEVWTENSKELSGSARAFHTELLGFQDYCIHNENTPFEAVGSKHLTDPHVLSRMSEYASTLETGGSKYGRILNFIKRGCEKQGYLRFCADRGERSIDQFADCLDYILEEYPAWLDSTKKSVGQRGKAGIKGKKNIQFLLKMPFVDRRKAMYDASCWLMKRAESFALEAKHKAELTKNAKGSVHAEKLKKSAAAKIRKALTYSRAALIQEMAFCNIPREGNLTELKYYPYARLQNERFSSFTWLRQRNRFRLYIPCHGASIINPDNGKTYRVLKNAEAKNAVDIDIDLPENLTPLIKKYLDIREQYITLDLIPFGGLSTPVEMEFFFPWRSIRDESINDPEISSLRRLFIEVPAKLGDSFKGITYQAYVHTAPEEKQHGINIHGLRHLVAETHLDEFPGDFVGAAAKLNDDPEQIIKTYGDRDRSKAMRRVAESEQVGSDFTY